jgi:hypothetical protein
MVPDGDKSSSLVLASTMFIWTSLLSVMKVTLNGVVLAGNEKDLSIEQGIHWNTLLRVQLSTDVNCKNYNVIFVNKFGKLRFKLLTADCSGRS